MTYVDGFVIPIQKKNLKAYKKIAENAGKVWMEHGALQYVECTGDDLYIKGVIPFPKLAKAKKNETVLFSWILFKSKTHRNKVNAKVMKDPRITKMDGPVPFDCKKIAYGGFKAIVNKKVKNFK